MAECSARSCRAEQLAEQGSRSPVSGRFALSAPLPLNRRRANRRSQYVAVSECAGNQHLNARGAPRALLATQRG
jgi:hypothetical protein